MKRQIAWIVCTVGMLALGVMAGGFACFAEDGAPDKKGKPAEKLKPATAEKLSVDSKQDDSKDSGDKKSTARTKSNLPSANRRLPSGYKSLELTDEQKEKIFRIREDHSAEVKELQKQLKDLRAQIDKEFRAVLTADQKKQLASQQEIKEQAAEDADADDDQKSAADKGKVKAESRTKADESSENS